MELQSVIVLCGVGVVGAAVLLLMGLFSTSGTSYEEARAQQRRATSELLALADNKNKSKKTNKKANKKVTEQLKKEKRENATAATGSEPDSEAPAESGVEDESVPSKPHVEFSSAVVVEHPSDNPSNINVKIRKRGKDPKIKPILINKEDPSCVSDPSSAGTPIAEVSNHFEEMHPKDEFELLHSSLEKIAEKKEEKKEEIVEKKESKVSKQSKGPKANPKQSTSDVVKEEPASEKRSTSEAPLEQRKVKKGEKKIVSETVDTVEEVVPLQAAPQPSELATDKLPLPAPQPAPSPPGKSKSKKKKAEQDIFSLKRVESASELILLVRQAILSESEIQDLTVALLDKRNDLLPTHSEWTEEPAQKMKKQLTDKIKYLEDEVEASKGLKAKIQELRTTLNAEHAAANRARADLAVHQARLQRLEQEKETLLGQISESEAKVSRMDLHIKNMSEAEGSLRAELTACVLDARSAREETAMLTQHHAELTEQLQAATLAVADLEQQRQVATHAEQLAQQELRQVQARLAGFNDLQNELQRLTARAQAAESNAETLKDDMQKQKEELTKGITSLQEQLADREAELAELKQLKSLPAQNGLPPSSVNEEQKIIQAAELAKVESTVESLRNELLSAQDNIAEQQKQVVSLQEQLAQYRDKNNELRIKNWKVVEALQTAEKSLTTRVAPAMPARDALAEAVEKAQEQHFVEISNVLRAVCPTAAPNTSMGGQDWLQGFAENLKKELLKKETDKQLIENNLASKLSEKDDERKQIEIELQKKLQEKELVVKEIENKMQQQIQDKELASKKIESELQKKLQDEITAKEQSEIELNKLKEELSINKKLVSELQKQDVKELDGDIQKKLEEKELAMKELESKMQQQIQDKELAYKKIESDLQKKLQDELTAKEQAEAELKKLKEELNSKNQQESELQKKEVKEMESEIQKKLQDKELEAKEIEQKMQQQIQDKELASKKIESELQKKLQDEITAKKQSESELKKLREELNIKKRLVSELQEKVVHTQQPIVDDSRVRDLEIQNEYLQGQVDKFKIIINDTENVLSRLQQKVTREEARWQNELTSRQNDLEALRQRTVQQMQTKVDSLKAELQKLQMRNHSHSFADAERIAEENLMVGFASNHDTDLHNGPKQESINISEL